MGRGGQEQVGGGVNRDVTIVTPTLPGRADVLQRAIRSCLTQEEPPRAFAIEVDADREGSGPTRTRALRRVATTWTAFLDDDDELRPVHLRRLLDVAAETGADVVAPWFTILGPDGRKRLDWDPFPQHRGRQYDLADPHIFPITCLVRTEVAQLGEFPAHHVDGWGGDDFAYWMQLARAGARIVNIEDRTWWWWHHGRNTSGLARKAEALYR